MTNYQKAREQINEILYPCGECRGNADASKCMCHREDHEGKCLGDCDCLCNGTGVDIPLEFGCEVLWNDKKHIVQQMGGVSADPKMDKNYIQIWDGKTYGEAYPKKTEVENLGKPPTLQEVQYVAYRKLKDELWNWEPKRVYKEAVEKIIRRLSIEDLSKQPSEWSEEVWRQLLELME